MNSPRSVYLHIPFCNRRCFYCDFAVVPIGDSARKETGPAMASINLYLDFLHREISMSPEGSSLSTIYIGGGTPSLLSAEQIESLLVHLKNKFGIEYGSEITMEVDPSTFSKKDIDTYVKLGINRLSVGGQSFSSEILHKIGRSHCCEQLIQSCHWVNEAYEIGDLNSWSLDLIQNLPNETLNSWESQLHQALETGAPHLSIYDLCIEPGTVFGRQFKKGLLKLPDDELSEEITISTNKILSSAAFSRYEISNYALPGHTSRHNRMYWSGVGWWAFGMGATSAPWGKRLTRPKTFLGYQNWISRQEVEGIHPSLSNKKFIPMPLDELFMIGLRRREGVVLEDVAKASGWSQKNCDHYLPLLIDKWEEFINRGLVIEQSGRFYLKNPKGMEISNQILVQMMIWWDCLPAHVVAESNS